MKTLVEFPGLGFSLGIDRIAFSIGDFSVYWYGVLIGTGILLALGLAFYKAKSFGINEDRMIDVIFIGAAGSIICARAYYVMFSPHKYDSFWDMINIRDGGIAIYGAIIGAFLFGVFACKWRKVPVLAMCDLASMGFLIGQTVGRWGNFVNQEAFGGNTTMPWGMISPATKNYLTSMQDTLAQGGITVNPDMPVHPTFLYESLWCLIGFVGLYIYQNRRKFDGEILLLYIVWYGLGRAWIEGLRTDSLYMFGNIRTSQVLAIISVVAALGVWVYAKNKITSKPVGMRVENEKENEVD